MNDIYLRWSKYLVNSAEKTNFSIYSVTPPAMQQHL